MNISDISFRNVEFFTRFYGLVKATKNTLVKTIFTVVKNLPAAHLQQLQRKERHKAAQDAADESGKHV